MRGRAAADPAEDEAAREQGKAWAFWQAAYVGNATDASGEPDGTPSTAPNNGQDALLDFAPVRLYLNAVPQGTLYLEVEANDSVEFLLARNLGVPVGASDAQAAGSELKYLTDKTTALAETNITNGQPTQCGGSPDNTSTIQNAFCQSEPEKTDDNKTAQGVELDGLQSGKMYDLLLSLTNVSCDNGGSPCPAEIKVVVKKPDGTVALLSEAPVDFRPLNQWMTVETTRSGNIQPFAYPKLQTPQVCPSGTTCPGILWAPIPDSATTLNVLVHGYNVSLTDALGSFFPEYFKRLYWAGMPVIMPQGKVQTVGLTWYGDINTYDWPDTEFSALENGAPLSEFIKTQAESGRTMTILAHSLGNMVVNSAIERLISHQETSALASIKSFVMNEAAIPSEAFDSGEATAPNQELIKYATENDAYVDPLSGAPDQFWQAEYSLLTPDEMQKWQTSMAQSVTIPRPDYGKRWSQVRPPGGVPDGGTMGAVPRRGSWLGFFSANADSVAITNTANPADGVLDKIWAAAQACEKPAVQVYYAKTISAMTCAANFASGFGTAGSQSDDQGEQFWAALRNTDAGEEAAFDCGSGGCSPSSCTSAACAHSNITRQWAELSYWFPSISGAEGLGFSRNAVATIDFSAYAPGEVSWADIIGGDDGSANHSYLTLQPYSVENGAWKQIRTALCGRCDTGQ